LVGVSVRRYGRFGRPLIAGLRRDSTRKRPKDEEEVYESVADYDPVLRSHCRL
jgi:hypothetical protein